LGPYFLIALVYQHFILEHFGHAGGKYRQDKLIPILKNEVLVYKGNQKIRSQINGPVFANDAVTHHAIRISSICSSV
jgi:hypothetical protein